MSVETYTTHKQILIGQVKSTALPCIVDSTGVVADESGAKIMRAGTPLYGENYFGGDGNREEALKKTGTTAIGILYQDVEFVGDATTANGTLVFDGTVDLLKVDETTRELITADVISALPAMHFVKGRE